MPATATTYNPSIRYGDAVPVLLPIKSGVAVNVGDFAFEDETDGYTGKPAMSVPWQTAIADPTVAPTVAALAGPAGAGFGAGTYKMQYTYVTGTGLESGPSPLSAGLVLTAGQGITVTGVTPPSAIAAVNWYVSAAGGSTTTLVFTTYNGNGFALTGPPSPAAVAPPAANSLSSLILTQQYFKQRFVGIAAQQYDGTAFTTTPAAYGIQDGNLRYDASGVFDFSCASQTFNFGDILALAQDVGNNLTGQTVMLAGAAQQAYLPSVRNIGLARVLVPYPNATTVVLARLLGTRFVPDVH